MGKDNGNVKLLVGVLFIVGGLYFINQGGQSNTLIGFIMIAAGIFLIGRK